MTATAGARTAGAGAREGGAFGDLADRIELGIAERRHLELHRRAGQAAALPGPNARTARQADYEEQGDEGHQIPDGRDAAVSLNSWKRGFTAGRDEHGPTTCKLRSHGMATIGVIPVRKKWAVYVAAAQY
jgi:hypothetical protein